MTGTGLYTGGSLVHAGDTGEFDAFVDGDSDASQMAARQLASRTQLLGQGK